MNYLCSYSSPLGPMTMASDGEMLTGLWFDGQKYDRAGLDVSSALTKADLLVFRETVDWLDGYFAGKEPGTIPCVKMEGSPFQRLVWELLCTIPSGTVVSYGELAQICAQRMGIEHMSAQAVGGAVGRNRISVLVPCHRVVGTNGALTGYAGGVERKAWLLAHEGIPTENTAAGVRVLSTEKGNR
ncbi:MAG: methylated-DNA--[protein]-cysteine S-methyltransferase [Oscillospiraceae bacterium]|nr:methylated-DNA--[protein]-cysteine S-methyltransferase [Oscillospiraceae bacterium]